MTARPTSFTASPMPLRLILLLLALLAAPARAQQGAPFASDDPAAALCAIIEKAAGDNALPVDYFTKLIWRESALHVNAISPAGARGIAQFMPGTAAARGLANPFDPAEAIPASAKYLSELRASTGNLGLAAAAYNAGEHALAVWRAGQGELPFETQDYVLAITGFSPDAWGKAPEPSMAPTGGVNCMSLIAGLRASASPDELAQTPFSPWGVQLSGGFSKARALAAFARAQERYAPVIADRTPFVLARRNRSRGWRVFFAVRLPTGSRGEAEALCLKLRAVGGACVTLRT